MFWSFPMFVAIVMRQKTSVFWACAVVGMAVGLAALFGTIGEYKAANDLGVVLAPTAWTRKYGFDIVSIIWCNSLLYGSFARLLCRCMIPRTA